MEWSTALGSIIAGYLIGAISFTRLIARAVIPEKDISRVEEPVPGTTTTFVMDSVSATTMRVHAGTKYGCLTAIFDMAKVAIPVLAIRLWQPDMPYHLLFASAAVAGHNWPVYYRFKGGRGESPMLGGMLVIDWLGVLVANVAGWLIGLTLGSLLVLRWLWMFLMIPWFWWQTGDPWHIGYAISVVSFYYLSLAKEMKQIMELKRNNMFPSQEAIANFLAMGGNMGRFMDRYSLFALYHRWKRGKTSPYA